MTRSIVALISHFHVSKNGNSLTTRGKKNYVNNCNWLIWDIRYDAVSSSMQVSVQWSLVECWLFRRRQAENRTEVCRRRNRKSWIRCGGRYKFTASNHKWTKPNWAAGGVVQKLMGRTLQTQPLMEGTCRATQHRLLLALLWAGLPRAVVACPHRILFTVGGKRIIWWQICPSLLLFLGAFLANYRQ